MNTEDVLAIQDIAGLRKLGPCAFMERDMTQAEFDHIARLCGALWLHSGNPEHPHAELTTGKCSNGFVDVLRILKFTNLCDILAVQLLHRIQAVYMGPIDWVIGSDHAGAALSHSVAIRAGAMHDFTEKGPDKTQLWRRHQIEPGQVVLQIEELMTTSATLLAVRQGIIAGNEAEVTFAPVVGVLVNRSGLTQVGDSGIISPFSYEIKTWDGPGSCELCAQGSGRLRPKTHWRELTQPD